jgi:hypothetical protein
MKTTEQFLKSMLIDFALSKKDVKSLLQLNDPNYVVVREKGVAEADILVSGVSEVQKVLENRLQTASGAMRDYLKALLADPKLLSMTRIVEKVVDGYTLKFEANKVWVLTPIFDGQAGNANLVLKNFREKAAYVNLLFLAI